MEQNILEYMKCNNVVLDNITVTKTDDQAYQIYVKDLDENAVNEKMQAVIAQIDRDEEHPIIMNKVEVISRVIKQPEPTENLNEYTIIVSVVPVIK